MSGSTTTATVLCPRKSRAAPTMARTATKIAGESPIRKSHQKLPKLRSPRDDLHRLAPSAGCDPPGALSVSGW